MSDGEEKVRLRYIAWWYVGGLKGAEPDNYTMTRALAEGIVASKPLGTGDAAAESSFEIVPWSDRKVDVRRDATPLVEKETGETSIPMLLWCPECGARHVDEGEWAERVHRTHACQCCGHTWRPAIVPTVGVQFLPGFRNA